MEGKSRILVVLAICLLMLWVTAAQATVRYVDSAKPDDTGNGLSWANAEKTVQAAIDASASGDEVWVKAGTYTENITFAGHSGVSLYGGFDGTENVRSERDWNTNVTTLNGNQSGSVVSAPYGVSSTLIDGFTITNGIGTLMFTDSYRGGGIYASSSITITHNIITGNQLGYIGGGNSGGGIHIEYGSSVITDNEISNNVGTANVTYGGGICLNGSGNVVERNVISNNSGCFGAGIHADGANLTIQNNNIAYNTGTYGGGIKLTNANGTVSNNLIARNSGAYGGGISCSSSIDITNNTVVYNNATIQGGGILISSIDSAIANNIIALNSGWEVYKLGSGSPYLINNCVYDIDSNLYYGISAGSTDMSEAPLFADADNDDFHLQSNSPCIDVGDDDAVGEDWVDLDGNFRQVDHVSGGSKVDIGAYEYPDITAPSTPVVTDDGDYTTTTISLHASWTSSDSESGIVEYQYAIGTTTGGTNVVAWTSTGTTTSVTKSGLNLTDAQTYYFTVEAKNGQGNWSTAGNSDGINIAPGAPSVVDDGAYTNSTTSLNATWSASTGTQSGVVEYQYAVGTLSTPVSQCFIVPWTSTGTITTANASSLNLQNGRTYYFYVKVKNAAGLWSTPGVSDGITVGTAQNLANRDRLSGIGGFEWSAETVFVSYYIGQNYDYTQCTWAEHTYPTQWTGYNYPVDNDRVAIGWMRFTTAAVNPGTNIEYDIVSDGVFGGTASGNCQTFAIKGNLTDTSDIACRTYEINVNNNDPFGIHTGDIVTFAIDKIKMADYSNLPSGASVIYRMELLTPEIGAPPAQKDLTPSTSTFSDSTPPKVIPATAKTVRLYVHIIASGNLGDVKPRIYIDDAHLYVSRNGSPVQVEMPVRIDRKIKTFQANYYDEWQDSYETARTIDWCMMADASASWVGEQMRSLRSDSDPDHKFEVLLYESANCTDARNSITGQDRWYNNSPLKFSDVLANHTDWLLSDGQGSYYHDSAQSHNEYFTCFENPNFQTAWAETTRELLERYHYDGLFVDTCALKMYHIYGLGQDYLEREPWKCQTFAHGIIPELREVTWDGEASSRKMQIVHNASGDTIVEDPPFGSIMWDPNWKLVNQNPPYDDSPYEDNTLENTFDGHFNETCFYKYHYDSGPNEYSSSYWKKCLDDMNTVKDWNNSITEESDQKWMHCYLEGVDRQNGSAYGIDGWIQFGMCSYLLGQNAWTTLGVTRNCKPDYDITRDYAVPVDAYYEIDANEYFCAREYYGDDDGSRGGIVVANASTSSEDFTPQSDLIDENGDFHPYGISISVGANKGRMFFNPSSYKCISMITAPLQNEILTSSTYTIAGVVSKNRSSQTYPSITQIRIDGGSWIDCNVNSSTGGFSHNWTGITTGSHTIESRAYFGSSDYEPLKSARICSL